MKAKGEGMQKKRVIDYLRQKEGQINLSRELYERIRGLRSLVPPSLCLYSVLFPMMTMIREPFINNNRIG